MRWVDVYRHDNNIAGTSGEKYKKKQEKYAAF